MPRRLVTVLLQFTAVALAALLASTVAADAATFRTDVVTRLGSRVDKARRSSGVRVLLPTRLDTAFERLYPTGSWRSGHYALELGAAKGCHGATACSVAAFLADKGATLAGGRKVTLARGRTGFYSPSTCGASCAAPQVQWREKGVLYTIQAKDGGTGRTDRARLVSLAGSAIRHGAR